MCKEEMNKRLISLKKHSVNLNKYHILSTFVYFLKEGFKKCVYEHTMFIKTRKEGKISVISLYVDDLIFTDNDELMITNFRNSMNHKFDMTDLGKMIAMI